MADTQHKPAEGARSQPVQTQPQNVTRSADAAPAQAGTLVGRGEALPEDDPVQVAHKQIVTNPGVDGERVRAKAAADLVDASPHAADTPSGHAVRVAAKESDDKRSDVYAREKARKRFGY